jgi:hypothetical protein
MKRFFFLFLFLMACISLMAQLSQKEKTDLINSVKSNYNLTQIDGASLYNTKSGYQVLVTVVSISSAKSIEGQNREAQTKATRLASEYLGGATNSSVTIHDSESSSNSSKVSLSEKIVQSSIAQVKSMQPLFKMDGSDGQNVFAYFLVISQTAAKNGVAGVLSIVPGVGQFYKGSTFKGTLFLGLTAAAVTGVIVSESTRSSYANKAIEQPKYKKDYSTKADNWETTRNICIGVGGAIWVWNIIDAFTTKSAKRKIVTSQESSLSFQPFATPNVAGQGMDIGLALSLNF